MRTQHALHGGGRSHVCARGHLHPLGGGGLDVLHGRARGSAGGGAAALLGGCVWLRVRLPSLQGGWTGLGQGLGQDLGQGMVWGTGCSIV